MSCVMFLVVRCASCVVRCSWCALVGAWCALCVLRCALFVVRCVLSVVRCVLCVDTRLVLRVSCFLAFVSFVVCYALRSWWLLFVVCRLLVSLVVVGCLLCVVCCVLIVVCFVSSGVCCSGVC